MPKILLIDDDEIGRDALARRLMRKGWQVQTSTDGDEGLDKARSSAPNLVIIAMSLVLPDGWEVTRQIKSDGALANVPVMAILEEDSPDERVKALDAGCDDLAAKPIHIEQVVEKIQRLLDRQPAS
ncbi:response regulator [bacterium]|nr:response regulator [bacterium]